MAHTHSQPHSATGSRLFFSLAVTLVFVAVEAGTGLVAHSLALLGDAGHNLADALALGLSWHAVRMGLRPSTARNTFGFHRVGILTALANALGLVVIALIVAWEAVTRFAHPQAVHAVPMIGAAGAAVAMNLLITVWLHRDAAHDVNIRSAYLHMLGDAVSAFGVVAAGIYVLLGGSSIADPIVSLVISALILYSSWGIMAETVSVLMESTPGGINMEALERAITCVDGVMNVHDLHVWTVGSGLVACSCHILVCDQSVSSGQQVLRDVCAELEHRFGITHSTVQLEAEGCNEHELYCSLRTHEHAGHSH